MGILSSGFGLFNAILETGPARVHKDPSSPLSRTAPTAPIYRNQNEIINPDLAFFSIYAQTIEEFYQFWAMWFALGAIILIIIKDYIPPIIKVILDFISMIRAYAGS